MKAAVLRELNQPLQIKEVDIDRPGPREVLIRTGATGVCHSDLNIIEGKLWVQRDGTEHGIANDLINAGVPKTQIVLGFRSPESRKHTGLAVA